MKGLLIKDFKLLKNQKTLFLIVIPISIMLLMTGTNPSFLISYVTIIFSMVSISTISNDESDNGNAFLFSLPISRKNYVNEKYVFSILIGMLAWAASTLASTIFVYIRHTEKSMTQWFIIAAIYLIVFVIFLEIVLPIQLKFGTERGRAALMTVVIILFLLVYAGMKGLKQTGADVSAIIDRMLKMSPLIGLLGVLAVCILGGIISYTVSLKIMNKKEF